MPSARQRPPRRSLGWIWWTAAGTLLIAGLIVVWGIQRKVEQPQSLLPQARSALSNGDYRRAEELACRIPERSAEWMAAAAIAGEAAAKAGRVREAVQHYLALAKRQQQSREPPLGYFYAAETIRDAGGLSDAEQYYRRFLVYAPKNAAAHERLAFLLSATGQRWESLPHYFALIRTGTASVPELTVFADLDRAIEQRPFLEASARKAPDDLLVKLGLAADDFWVGNASGAEARLRSLLAAAPELAAGQALLGELLVNHSDQEFLDWYDRLPINAADHPDVWYVRGLWARKHNALHVAARCFWETVRMAPTHRRATYHLGQVLRSLGEDGGDAFESRAQLLIQLTQAIDEVLRTESKYQQPFRRVVELMERMGRVWEACAWSLSARQQFPDVEWPQIVLSRMSKLIGEDLPIVTATENLALRYDLSRYPEFSAALESQRKTPVNQRSSEPSLIRFSEATDGPEFAYFNGSDPFQDEITDPVEQERAKSVEVRVRIRTRTRSRIFEQNGGGVAVIDFDVDGWPDLFFSQGAVWKHGSDGPTFDDVLTDRLFGNRRGQSFADVSAQVGIVDRGFGQGCAVGDFDNDGFPDLYVANIGRNQLYHNNGDGTFSDVSEASGMTGDDWTSSCAIVDLNADGHPDVYDVNYLTGPEVYKAICEGHTCSPKVFAAAPDRLLISRGDGTFESVRPIADESHGKGLGIVALDLYERNRPCLFIANDQVPNFLLRNRATGDWPHVLLEDEAFVSGVAYNQDGLAMASMGIAADDVNGDGRVDLYVSTFKDEASMLFMQDAQGLFVDSANAVGLRGATWPFVGWGTQFLDADLDGDVDLVGVNGHVDDYRDEGGEYHMRPQFFRNLGSERFAELRAEEIGSFFDQKRLGRGLARLDWNRDGRMDFAVSNIGDRASLVTNVTNTTGHFINVRLHARSTARDAIGSLIDVRAGDRTWRKQLLAGDGYMASNERLVQFGLGEATEVAELTVHWPSGTTSTVQRAPIDSTLDLVESAAMGIVWSDPESPEVIAVTTGRER